MQTRVLALAALVLAAGSAFGQAEATKPAAAPKQPEAKAPAAAKTELKAGDAPAITVEKFLKGEPVTGFEKGKVYVVEFWATWCGPCIAAFPHLSELQKDHKNEGLTIIGFNIWEDKRGKPYTAETPGKVAAFVEKQAERMSYTVAYDGETRAMDKAYMQAAKRNGIPSMFIVNQEGKIAAIGHPMFLDEVLPKVLAGKWNAKEDGAKVAKAEESMNKLFSTPMMRDDPKGALEIIDAITKDFPKVGGEFAGERAQLLLKTGDFDKAYKALGEQVDKAINDKNAQTLNAIAWGIVDPEAKVSKKDLTLALKAAQAAVEISKGEDGAILDTLARVYFEKGEVDKAIETQTKAIEKAPAQQKAQLQEALNEYKAKKNGK